MLAPHFEKKRRGSHGKHRKFAFSPSVTPSILQTVLLGDSGTPPGSFVIVFSSDQSVRGLILRVLAPLAVSYAKAASIGLILGELIYCAYQFSWENLNRVEVALAYGIGGMIAGCLATFLARRLIDLILRLLMDQRIELRR